MSTPDAQRRAQLLVVDDDPGMLHATLRVLRDQHDVHGAASAAEAITIAAQLRPDLLVTDIRMPGMDGFALAAELRRRCGEMDVIYMTGSRTEPDAHLVKAIQDQAFYFIQKPFDRLVLRTLVDRCLELRRLRAAERAHIAHLEGELAEARVFQRAMLGPESAELAGLRIEARCRPCQELGGDLYDFAITPDERLAFIVADVRGHGASAAMMTAIVKSVFHSPSTAYRPGPIAELLAQAVAPFGEDRFITAVIGALDARAGTLEWVGAGHPPFVHTRAPDKSEFVPSLAPIITPVFPPGSWQATHATLGERWRLLVYTDGLSDALALRSSSSSAWLEARDAILRTAVTSAGDSPARLADALITLAVGPRPITDAGASSDALLPDDVTVLVLERA